MKIKRLVDPYEVFNLGEEPRITEITYELTPDEIKKAYEEQEYLYRINDIKYTLESLIEFEGYTEEDMRLILENEEAMAHICNEIDEIESDKFSYDDIMYAIKSYFGDEISKVS